MSETANQQTETLVGATLRDNDFTLKMTGMSDMTFEIKAHSIKEGQPWGGISQIICVDGECTITVQAGRKGSSDVADWFKSQVGSGSAVGCGTIDMWPSEMNFAFIGTMTYKHGGKTYTGQDIVIGQGHNGRNNWWVGGPNMSGISLPIVAGALAQTFTRGGLPVAKTIFITIIGDVSSMRMGLIEL